MKRIEPEIETCAFERGSITNTTQKRWQRFKIYTLLDKIQENLKELKSIANDRK